jgi:hypothetical protein
MVSSQWQRYYADKSHQHRDAAEWLLGNRCAKCKTTQGPFEFDHINRKTKEFGVGSKLHYSWAKIYKELLKCQLLCKPCHYAKTASEGPWNKGQTSHGSHHSAYTLKCKCTLCGDYKDLRNARRRSGTVRFQTRELVHGTRAGYLKESRRKIPHCDDCTLANTVYTKELRARTSASFHR